MKLELRPLSGAQNKSMPPGYSGTPLGKKLRVKVGHPVALVDAPDTWRIPISKSGVHLRCDLVGNPTW